MSGVHLTLAYLCFLATCLKVYILTYCRFDRLNTNNLSRKRFNDYVRCTHVEILQLSKAAVIIFKSKISNNIIITSCLRRYNNIMKRLINIFFNV